MSGSAGSGPALSTSAALPGPIHRSIFGLVESTVAAFGGGPVGQLQDSTRDNRLAFVRGSLLTQNACIAASVAAMLPVLLLSHRDATGAVQVSWWFALAAGATMLLGSLARLGSIGSNVAVERDWVTVVAGGDAARLADMNATMRRLDLVCKILAPIVAGLLLSGTSPAVVVIFIGAWNVLSMAPELLFLQWAFAAEPRLALSPPPPKQPQRPAQLASYGTLPVDAPEVDAPPARPSCWAVATSSCRTLGSGWRVWARQRIFPAALALSLLYVSTIAFGAIMTVFLNWAGIPVFALAAARGVGAAFGVLATLTFKPCVLRGARVTRCDSPARYHAPSDRTGFASVSGSTKWACSASGCRLPVSAWLSPSCPTLSARQWQTAPSLGRANDSSCHPGLYLLICRSPFGLLA